MGGWYRMGGYDARQLGRMVGDACCGRNRVARATMALWCWSQMQANGRPCPHFNCGLRTIAEECGVSFKTARAFMGRLERDGWVVRLGTVRNKGGEYVMRTFVWVAEEAADKAGRGLDEWLSEVGGCAPERAHRGVLSAEEKGTPVCPIGPEKGTHQSAEHSEGALRLSANAEAQAPENQTPPTDPMTLADVDLAPSWLGGGADA